jgi:hypothetical protein
MSLQKTISPEKFAQNIPDFIEHCSEKGKPLTVIGFINFCGMCKSNFYEDYCVDEKYKKTCSEIKQLCEADTLEQSLLSNYQPHIAKLILNSFGYKEEKKI